MSEKYVDIRGGMPDGWTRTSVDGRRLKAAGVEYKKALTGWRKIGVRVVPETVTIARISDLAKLESAPKKSAKSADEKVAAWARRLARLAGIAVDEAMKIARAKLAYKADRIAAVEARGYSRERAKLLRRMERENPLRRIEDEAHAEAIMAAHERHSSTDYERRLAIADEVCERCGIDRTEKQSMARTMSAAAMEEMMARA